MAASDTQHKQSLDALVFVLHIEESHTAGAYNVRASLLSGVGTSRRRVRAENEVVVRFPERLLRRAASLLQPQSQLHGGDEDLMGSFLARQLFVADVRQLLMQGVMQAREAETTLSIALRIDAPELATLPWEYLTLAGKTPWSPALLNDYGVVRFVGSRAIAPIRQPMRWSLLQRAASPTLMLVAPAEHDAVLLAIRRELRPLIDERKLRCKVLVAPTVRELGRAISKERPDLVHILARAEFDEADVPMLFLDEPLATGEIVDMLGDARPVMILDGSWRATGTLAAASNRLAQGLVQRLLPAAIAFHSPLSPDESATFARSFYGQLADRHSLHEAMIVARQALETASQRAAWGLPILVQREAAHTASSSATATQLLGSWGVPLLAGSLALAIAASVGLAGRSAASEQAIPAALSSASAPAASATNASDMLSVFRVGLPTPTFAPPIATPTLGLDVNLQDSGLKTPPTPLPEPASPPAKWTIYLVEPGDTVASIAERMGSDPSAIASLNRVTLDDALIPGRGLMIPVYREGAPGRESLDVNRGRQDMPLVALTFDTEIDDKMLYQICDILRERNLHATFFVTGNWVRAYPDAARTIVANGHELGNHSLTHPNFTMIGLDGAASEIDKTEAIIRETTGVDPRPFFRFPYGGKNPQVLSLLGSKGYISYHWTADDGAIPGWLAATAANPRSGYGAILLMHERPQTIAALPGWLDQLAQMGLQPVPLSQILR